MMSNLYNISLSAACRAFDPPNNVECLLNDIPIVKLLPKYVVWEFSKRLKQLWMKETMFPFSFNVFDSRHINFNQIDKYEFIMLTNYPDNTTPDFWPISIRAHVYFNYYEFWLHNSDNVYSICRSCFLEHNCKPCDMTDDFSYYDYWTQMGWRFFNVVSHFRSTPSEFVKDVLKKEPSWCDFCVLTPLFNLYDWDRCTEYTTVHDYEDDSEEGSNDSCLQVCDRTELFDPYSW